MKMNYPAASSGVVHFPRSTVMAKPTASNRAFVWGSEDYGRSETSTVTLNFVSNSDGSQDCK